MAIGHGLNQLEIRMRSMSDIAGMLAKANVLRLGSFIVVCACSSPALASTQYAPADGAAGSDTIIVSARRREESIVGAPVALTFIPASDLAISRSPELISASGSNVELASGANGSGNSSIAASIRGVGQRDFLFTVEPSVSVNLDGVYLGNSVGGNLDLIDIDHIEILKGPQGTLFGKNAVGGAIQVFSHRPTDRNEADIELTAGSLNRFDISGAANLAVDPGRFSIRFAGAYRRRDGYATQLDYPSGRPLDRLGDIDQRSIRIAGRYTPSPQWTFDLAASASRSRQKERAIELLAVNPAGSILALWNGLVGQPAAITPGRFTTRPYTTYGTGPNADDLKSFGVTATASWTPSTLLTVKAISSYRETQAHFGRDGDGTPANYIATDNSQDIHQFSQEFQVSGGASPGSVKWTAGVYYLRQIATDINNVVTATGLYQALGNLPGPLDGSSLASPTAPGGPGNPLNSMLDLTFHIYNHVVADSYAVYGQATIPIGSATHITTGLRYTWDKKAYTLEHLRVISGQPLIPLSTIRGRWGALTPMVSIDHSFSNTSMVYASAATGFKSGGFNGRPLSSQLPEPFNPEHLTSVEIGAKYSALSNRFFISAAAFYSFYNDVQLTTTGMSSNGVLTVDTRNAGDARIYGAEIDFRLTPLAGFWISGFIGSTSFRYVRLNKGVDGVSFASKRAFVPSFNGKLGLSYQWKIGPRYMARLQADANYSSGMYMEETNDPALFQKAHALVNLQASIRDIDRGLELSAFVTNLTNYAYLVTGLSLRSSLGTVEGTYGRPREWGLAIKAHL